MTYIRKLILALALSAGLAPAFAQVAPPVPALPDTERRTSYSITASVCSCNVNFALYGDSTDYANWIEVFVNGVRMAQAGNWTLSSVTGTIGSIPLPITNAVLTFTAPQTGTIQIVGARRPRRTSQFNEGAGIPTRNMNVVISDLTAQNRELWDKTNDVTGRALISQPGVTLNLLPLPAACAGRFLGFDATGLIPQCSAAGAGSGNVVGPLSSVNGNVAVFNGTTGVLLADSGTKPVTPLTCSTSNWFRTLSAAGTLGCSQPGALDVTFTQTGTGATARTVQTKLQERLSVLDFGAVGDGVANDTTAIQAAFTAAATSGQCVYVPAGSYKITAQLTGAVRCIIGDGYQGYGSTTAYVVNSTQTTGFAGTAFVCSLTINCIALTSNNAFYLKGFLIQYPATVAGSNITALTLSALGGSTNVNSGTVIEDVQIAGADNSVLLNNIFEFKIDGLKIVSGWVSGLTISSPNYKSFGDSTITNSTFWANGVAGHQYHIGINSGGGIRTVNNKFNFGGVNTSCIILQPNLVVQQSEEPNIIANNSMEACSVGINFNNGNVANADISQTTITGNQIWAGTAAIFVNSNGVGQWINGLTVTSNSLWIVGGAAKTVNTLNNINGLRWSNNNMECSGGCTGNSTGVAIGANVTNSIIGSDTFGPTLIFHYTSTSSVVFDDPSGVTFARLPASAANGSKVFVTDGAPGTSPCTGSSTGATALRQNGAWMCSSSTLGCAPDIQTKTTGTNLTYTPATCNSVAPKYIEMKLYGAGGGSAGAAGTGGSPTAGGNGGDTCVKASGTACTTPLYAGLGGIGGSLSAGTSAAGGSFTGSCDVGLPGASGGGPTNQINAYGPVGGGGTAGGFGGSAPPAVPVNTGLGAGGPGSVGTGGAGGGGGQGGFCRVKVFSPLTTYVYTIGAAGTAGAAGTTAAAGVIGGNGRIEFTAYFQ